jgi:hypothetical protein
MNIEIGAEAALFPEKEYIKGIDFLAVQQQEDLSRPEPLHQQEDLSRPDPRSAARGPVKTGSSISSKRTCQDRNLCQQQENQSTL